MLGRTLKLLGLVLGSALLFIAAGNSGLVQAQNPQEQPAVVLLIEDNDPWDYPSNQQALGVLDVPYEAINSAQVGEGEKIGEGLTQYPIVLIPSDQTTDTYYNLVHYQDTFASYVEQGGVLVVHAADHGSRGGTWGRSFLPGGVNYTYETTDHVSIANPSHPLITGSPLGVMIDDAGLQGWNHSGHGYFTNLPDNADTIIASSDGPTYIEYCYGDGIVLATTEPLEYAWQKGLNPALLLNELNYILSPECGVSVNQEVAESHSGTLLPRISQVEDQEQNIKQVKGDDLVKLEREARIKTLERMLQAKGLKDELKNKLSEWLADEKEQAQDKAKEVAKSIGENLLGNLLEVFNAGKFANIILTVAIEAGKLGGNIGQWVVQQINNITRCAAIRAINAGEDPFTEVRSFPYLIDWHVIIVDSNGNPVSASYSFAATTENDIGPKGDIKKSGATKTDGYDNEGNKEQLRDRIPIGLSNVKVWTRFWPFRSYKTIASVEFSINGPQLADTGNCGTSLIVYRIVVKITIQSS